MAHGVVHFFKMWNVVVVELKGNPLPQNIISLLNDSNGIQKLLAYLFNQVHSMLILSFLDYLFRLQIMSSMDTAAWIDFGWSHEILACIIRWIFHRKALRMLNLFLWYGVNNDIVEENFIPVCIYFVNSSALEQHLF